MLNFEELDHEFITEGNPAADAENIAGLIQQNLTPEEQNRLKEIAPILEEYNMLMVKVHTGKTVEELEKSGDLEALGVPRNEGPGMEVAQEGQTQRKVPSRPVEREVAKNAPEIPQEMPQMALGDKVPPVIQENVEPMGNPGDVAAGPVGVVNDPRADASGTADDIPAESDGFVINAAAVRKIGVRKLYDLIEEAITYLEEKGVKLDTSKIPVDAEKILVSKGEVIIPDVIAAVIGYDKLEEINGVGTEETKEILAAQEEGAPPEGPPANAPATPPVLQDQMTGLT